MRNAIALGVVLLATAATAQTPPVAGPGARAGWDHDRVQTVKFEGQVDGGASGVTHQIGMPPTNLWTLPAMVAGNHTIQVRACNAAGCSAWSAPLEIQVIVVPGVPSRLRLEPATINTPPAARLNVNDAIESVRTGRAAASKVPGVPGEPRFE